MDLERSHFKANKKYFCTLIMIAIIQLLSLFEAENQRIRVKKSSKSHFWDKCTTRKFLGAELLYDSVFPSVRPTDRPSELT